MSIIAVYSIKGGVGKTAAAVNLAYLAAADGFKTLICDLDPQGATTYYFRVRPKLDNGVNTLVKGRKQLARSIKGTDYRGLDLLPADFSFRNLDLAYDQKKRSKKRLLEVLAPLAGEYDHIFLDCPPNLTLLSENIFHAADVILSPMIPTSLSRLTYEKLLAFFKSEGLDASRILAFFSMVENRKKLHREIRTQMASEYDTILANHIPYVSEIEQMGHYREPVMCFKPRSVGARSWLMLWQEIKTHLKSED